MSKSFEIHEFHFVLCIVVHEFKLLLQEHGHIRLNSIPEITAFSGEIITDSKNESETREIFVKIKPAGWPKKCHLRIRLQNITGNWVPDSLLFYYPEVIDILIKFEFTNNTGFKLVPSGDLDEKIWETFIKPELIN